MKDFNGKLAVVTGGASGVGFAIGEALAKEGAKVILTDVEQESLEASTATLVEQSLEVSCKVADVSDPSSMHELAKWCKSEHGPVHLLFNNAGVAPAELLPIWDTKPNDWQWAYGVNVMGVLHGIQAFVPDMLAHGEEARVINTCSGNGAFINLPSTPIYTSSKASVSSITEVLKLQLDQAEANLKVSILFPGPHTVRTKLFSAERNRPKELARDPDAPEHPISSVEDMLEMMSSMGIEMETTEPEEVASFCLSQIKLGNYWINPLVRKVNRPLRIEWIQLLIEVIYPIQIFFKILIKYERTDCRPFFNPSSKDFIHDPIPTLQKLSSEYPISRFDQWQAWLVTGHENILKCLLDPRLSTDFNLWEYAPEKKAIEDMDPFEKLMNNNLFFLDRKNHLRLRKLALPAFSPRIMEQMKERFTILVKERFDEIGTPDSFNFAAEVAEIVPTQAIASLVGIPRDKFPIFDSLAYGVVRGINPMLTPEERRDAIKGVPEGLNLLNELIDERRKNPGDDFLSTLILAEDQGSKLSNMEMCALVGAVLGAGSDTAVDLHSYLIKTLLQHPDQLQALKDDESLVQGAISETLRYESSGKTGLARYASEDININGFDVKKGQMVQLITSTAGMDPKMYNNPEEFDIKRDHDKSISFGQGPHYCIGVTLVRSQTEVMLRELFKRFPNISLGNEIVYDYNHHNARRMDVMTVNTNL